MQDIFARVMGGPPIFLGQFSLMWFKECVKTKTTSIFLARTLYLFIYLFVSCLFYNILHQAVDWHSSKLS